MKKISMIALAIVLSLTVFAMGSQAASSLSGSITINGSSALLPLMLQAKKEFNQLHPRVKIAVAGTASINGPMSVKKGVVTIGSCDWDSSKDVPGFKKFTGQVNYKIAAIPFAFVVHPSNPVQNLTQAQVIDIYKGNITNWSEVGGNNATIVVNNRVFGSGTRVNVTQFGLNGMKNAEFVTGANYVERASSGNMKTGVSGNVNAIGYIDLVYVDASLKALKFNNVTPSTANVINKTYPVWGYGFLQTNGAATGVNKAFIDYIQSKKFQNGSVKKLKFIPATAIK